MKSTFFILLVLLLGATTEFYAFGDGEPLDLTHVRVVKPAPGFLESLVLRYLPSQLTPTLDRDEAQRQIQQDVIKKVGEDLSKDVIFKMTSAGRLVDSLKKYSVQSLNLVSANQPSLPPPLKFQIEADRFLATLKYQGILNSDLSYVGVDKNFILTISKNLGPMAVLSLKEQAPVSCFDVSHMLMLGYTF